MIKVLIVDDSPTARTLLKHILQGSEGIQIAAVAASGADAISLTQQYRPDVILMDAIMPDMDGLEATRQIMEHQPTPIVIISSAASDSEANLAFHAIRAGALTVLGKPNGPGHPDFDVQARKIQRTLRSMASVAVIHHRRTAPRTPDSRVRPAHADEFRPEIVGIVASTGGPGILSRMLEELPPDYPLPIVIVQHISKDFMPSLIKWLGSVSRVPVAQAVQDEAVEPGRVYIAPDSYHARITSSRRFDLSAEPRTLFTPSGNILLESIASVYGANAIGVVLTGMGDDGVAGLTRLREQNAMTIAQDEQTSVVYGMPRAAIEQGAARQVLSPQGILGYLRSVAQSVSK